MPPTQDYINFHHVPELSTSGAFVHECQTCGALVYSRFDTQYEWQRLNDGATRHEQWHHERGK